MIINASNYEQITLLARAYGIVCEERYDLGDAQSPVILSDTTDPTGEVANTLASQGVPVLYLAYDPPVNLSPSISILKGGEVRWEQIYAWIQSSNQTQEQKQHIAHLNVKRTVGFFGIQPGVGAGSIARALSFYSAMNGKKTLYIDMDIRFPKAPYLIGYKDSRYTLEGLLEALQSKERPNMEPYFLHKSKMGQVSKQLAEHFKKLPDLLYVLSPSADLGFEYFPTLGTDLNEITDYMKKIVEGAKPFFENIIFSMGSDPDEPLHLAILRACDQRVFVMDTSPSAVRLFPQRIKLLENTGVPMDGAQVILNKLPEKMDIDVFEEFLQRSVTYTVPYDPQMITEIHKLNLLGGKSFESAIGEIAEGLLGLEKEAKRREAGSKKTGRVSLLSQFSLFREKTV